MKYTSEQSWQVPSVQDVDDDDSIDLRAAFRTRKVTVLLQQKPQRRLTIS